MWALHVSCPFGTQVGLVRVQEASVLYTEFGYSLCFRDWQQPTFQARILNELDLNGNNKTPFLVLSLDFLQLSAVYATELSSPPL